MKIITISIGSKRAEVILHVGNQRITRHLRHVEGILWQDDPKQWGHKYTLEGDTFKRR